LFPTSNYYKITQFTFSFSNNFPFESSHFLTNFSFNCPSCHSQGQGSCGKLLKAALGSNTQLLWPIWLVHRAPLKGSPGTSLGVLKTPFYTCMEVYLQWKGMHQNCIMRCLSILYYCPFTLFLLCHIRHIFHWLKLSSIFTNISLFIRIVPTKCEIEILCS